ncbi:Uncharacterised protein [Mycobacteroides abscessus subsp. abscessus]|nr:Uncharacterised protein [Mycobacteroides abscessus subsp. abscessus]
MRGFNCPGAQHDPVGVPVRHPLGTEAPGPHRAITVEQHPQRTGAGEHRQVVPAARGRQIDLAGTVPVPGVIDVERHRTEARPGPGRGIEIVDPGEPGACGVPESL